MVKRDEEVSHLVGISEKVGEDLIDAADVTNDIESTEQIGRAHV